MDKPINIRKGVESQPITVVVESGQEACGKTTTENGVICVVNKVYRPSLTSTYNETELLQERNDGMELLFRYYGRSLNQAKESLPPRDDVMGFYVRTNTKDLEKNMKLLGCPSDLQYNVKEVVTE